MSIVGGANLDIPDILAQVISPMGNGFARGQRGPVMVIHLDWGLSIGVPRAME